MPALTEITHKYQEEFIMKKILACVLAALMATVCLVSCGKGKTNIKFATGGTTGTYYAYGGVLATEINDKASDLNVIVQSTGASKANIQLVADGKADVAVVQNDVMYYAYTGTDLFADEGKIEGFSAVGALYAEVCQIIATDDIETVADLAGKNVSVGDVGSGVEFNAKQILAAYGLTFDDINVQNLSFGDSADAFKDGKIDAFFCVAGAPTTAVTDLATTKAIKLLEIDDEHAEKLAADYPFYTTYTIPADTYTGVDAAQTVAVKATLIASDKLPEETVYSFIKTIFDNKDTIAHDKAKELDLSYAVDGISIPFHAGAAKFFSENGINVG